MTLHVRHAPTRFSGGVLLGAFMRECTRIESMNLEHTAIPARLIALTLLCCGLGGLSRHLTGQTVALGVPVIAAVVKGPNQINLVWNAISNPGYGYLVEIQSATDSRYSAWQELKPIPPAGGYQCDATVQISGATCTISDVNGAYIYAPPSNGVPYWVTESAYLDPQDGSGVQ